jgi:uncharacterized protein (TIGR01732 family)
MIYSISDIIILNKTKGSVNMYNNVNVAPSMGSNMPFPYENVAPMMGANMPFPHENIAPVMGANMPFQPEFSCGYAAPAYENCYPSRGCGSFVLIVVLFILLIIVGSCTFHFQGDKDCK